MSLCVVGRLSKDRKSFAIQVVFRGGEHCCFRSTIPAERRELDHFDEPLSVDYDNRPETKNKIKRRLYVILKAVTGKSLPWGSLTGIRPAKIALTLLEEGKTQEEIADYMKEMYFADDEKIRL